MAPSHCITSLLVLILLTTDLTTSRRSRSRSQNDDFGDALKTDNEKGLFIWRIEDFSPVPLPKDHYGKFHNADSYIVLLSKVVDGRIARGDKSEILFYIMFVQILIHPPRYPLLDWQ